jgi:hypothetical protein
MKTRMAVLVLAMFTVLVTNSPAHSTIVYSDHVTSIVRGNPTVGNFPGFYGGAFPGAFPVVLTQPQAEAAVVGAPNTTFLSLPGNESVSPTPPGGAFPWAYVEVGFAPGFTFGASADLIITELGANQESAHLFIWTTDGSNAQPQIVRDGTDTIVVDLSSFAALVATHGEFVRVGVGGLDLNGASQGFDLDAVGVNAVAEPSALLVIASGFIALVGLLRVRQRSQLGG